MSEELRELLEKVTPTGQKLPAPWRGPFDRPAFGGMVGSPADANERLAAYLWNHAEEFLTQEATIERLEGERDKCRAWLQHDLDGLGTPEEARAEREALTTEVERLRGVVKGWHRPWSPSGNPCVCAACEDLALARAALEEGQDG